MSRTYRKSKETDEENFERHLADELRWWHRNPTKQKRTKKSEAELKVDSDRVEKEYHDACVVLARERGVTVEEAATLQYIVRRNGGSYHIVRRGWSSNWNYERIPVSREEVVAEAKTSWGKYNRDGGRWGNGGARAYWRKLTNKAVRTETRKLINSVMKDEDYDKPYPGDYLGKKYIWSVW